MLDLRVSWQHLFIINDEEARKIKTAATVVGWNDNKVYLNDYKYS